MADPIDIFEPHWYVGAANLLRGFSAAQRAKMDQGLQEIAAAGAQIALMDYLTAVRRRAELGAAMRRFHETYDLLLTPTLPLAAFEAGQERPDPARQPRWINWAPFSNPFNLTQQPAASVPCGLTAAGLPVGLQIVGPMHADALVLRAARAFEAARPWPLPEAPRLPPSADRARPIDPRSGAARPQLEPRAPTTARTRSPSATRNRVISRQPGERASSAQNERGTVQLLG